MPIEAQSQVAELGERRAVPHLTHPSVPPTHWGLRRDCPSPAHLRSNHLAFLQLMGTERHSQASITSILQSPVSTKRTQGQGARLLVWQKPGLWYLFASAAILCMALRQVSRGAQGFPVHFIVSFNALKERSDMWKVTFKCSQWSYAIKYFIWYLK